MSAASSLKRVFVKQVLVSLENKNNIIVINVIVTNIDKNNMFFIKKNIFVVSKDKSNFEKLGKKFIPESLSFLRTLAFSPFCKGISLEASG